MNTNSKLSRFAGIILLLACSVISASAAETLNIFCWSEYIPRTVIDAFERETGVKVTVENYASNEEMLSKLLAGGGAYDLIQPSEYTVEALIKAKLLLPLDRDKIQNIKNLGAVWLDQPFDPGNRYSVPWMSGTVGIVVNTERVKDPVEGFTDVFNGKHKGRIVAVDDAREMVSWALATLKISANDITPATLAKARPILAKWLPQIKVFDSDSPKTALLGGDVDIGIVWSGEGATLYNHDPNRFQWVLPNEGSHSFIDNLAIPKTCKHKETAERFIDFVLRPEISKLVSDVFPYTNPNEAARRLLTQAQLDNPASYTPGKVSSRRPLLRGDRSPEPVVCCPPIFSTTDLEIFRDIGPMASEVDAMVTELKSGGR